MPPDGVRSRNTTTHAAGCRTLRRAEGVRSGGDAYLEEAWRGRRSSPCASAADTERCTSLSLACRLVGGDALVAGCLLDSSRYS
ncbi:hypothetical protein EYF80_046668 [Liparis tanakae]|uniref:Uncharacterized protein n=1 Tax=Liparis tanakae TaxID=230148 RepID=A0A4Z2FPI2_9TELE|nr:hypothetical protein EYF80_046668 [Liparis tanakae]